MSIDDNFVTRLNRR